MPYDPTQRDLLGRSRPEARSPGIKPSLSTQRNARFGVNAQSSLQPSGRVSPAMRGDLRFQGMRRGVTREALKPLNPGVSLKPSPSVRGVPQIKQSMAKALPRALGRAPLGKAIKFGSGPGTLVAGALIQAGIEGYQNRNLTPQQQQARNREILLRGTLTKPEAPKPQPKPVIGDSSLSPTANQLIFGPNVVTSEKDPPDYQSPYTVPGYGAQPTPQQQQQAASDFSQVDRHLNEARSLLDQAQAGANQITSQPVSPPFSSSELNTLTGPTIKTGIEKNVTLDPTPTPMPTAPSGANQGALEKMFKQKQKLNTAKTKTQKELKAYRSYDKWLKSPKGTAAVRSFQGQGIPTPSALKSIFNTQRTQLQKQNSNIVKQLSSLVLSTQMPSANALNTGSLITQQMLAPSQSNISYGMGGLLQPFML